MFILKLLNFTTFCLVICVIDRSVALSNPFAFESSAERKPRRPRIDASKIDNEFSSWLAEFGTDDLPFVKEILKIAALPTRSRQDQHVLTTKKSTKVGESSSEEDFFLPSHFLPLPIGPRLQLQDNGGKTELPLTTTAAPPSSPTQNVTLNGTQIVVTNEVDTLLKQRKAIFRENFEAILAHNELYEQGLTSFRMGLNHLAADSLDEIREKYGGLLDLGQQLDDDLDLTALKMLNQEDDNNGGQLVDDDYNWIQLLDGDQKNSSKLVTNNLTSLNPKQELLDKLILPQSFDWREYGCVTPVKNQRTCASCYAYGAIATLESHYCIRNYPDIPSFSEQQVLDCSWSYSNKGCIGGLIFGAYNYVAENRKLCLDSVYPYRNSADNTTCNSHKSKCSASRQLELEYPYYHRLPPRNAKAIAKAIVEDGPVACEFTVTMAFAYYAGGVFSGDPLNCNETAKRDHILVIVGFDRDAASGKDFWWVRNSWSDKWGLKGYVRIERGKNVCNLERSCRVPKLRNYENDAEDFDEPDDNVPAHVRSTLQAKNEKIAGKMKRNRERQLERERKARARDRRKAIADLRRARGSEEGEEEIDVDKHVEPSTTPVAIKEDELDPDYDSDYDEYDSGDHSAGVAFDFDDDK